MRVLEICVELNGGGIDRYIYNYCRRIPNIHFDYVVVEQNKVGMLEQSFIDMGSQIYRVPRLRNGIKENYAAIKKILEETHYDAVHVHLGESSWVALMCAKHCGIQARIVHAHIAFRPESKKERIKRKVFTALTEYYATSLVACGIDAAKWVWGENNYSKGNVTIINNAIQTKAYSYSDNTRNNKRKELGIKSSLVVGYVGRLSAQKNPFRMLEIFQEVLNEKGDAVLLIVGTGELEEELKTIVKELHLDNKVIFAGVRNDVAELLNVMDVFLFPTLFEGLPFTMVEAQSNGLPIITSDNVTEEIKICSNVEYLSLNESNTVWAQHTIIASRNGRVSNAVELVSSHGFDVEVEAGKLREFYTKCIYGE